MTCVSSGIFCSLLFFTALFVTSQTLAKPGNSANSTPVSSTATKQCNNAYYSFYHNGGTNEKTETILQEIEKRLTQVQDDINILKGNNTSDKKPNKTIEVILPELIKQLIRVQDDIDILKANNTMANEQNKEIKAILQEMKKQLTQMQDDINSLKGNKTMTTKATKNCAELYKSGQRISGVYTIDPDGSGAFDVFCDQTTAGGGWTVFQKRLDGSVDFYRGWADYKRGFGNLNGEFWLGLDKIHRLTKTKNRLRVDLEDTAGKTAYAEYDMFAAASEKTKYKLSLGSYSGTAGDSLSFHRGYPFSTKDQDNDGWGSNCAVEFKGAWWYGNCHKSNLNGLYHKGKHSSFADGVNWFHWKGYKYSAKRAEMKIRPEKF
ncbi:ficolin-2-like [Oculina patagonica]